MVVGSGAAAGAGSSARAAAASASTSAGAGSGGGAGGGGLGGGAGTGGGGGGAAGGGAPVGRAERRRPALRHRGVPVPEAVPAGGGSVSGRRCSVLGRGQRAAGRAWSELALMPALRQPEP